MKTTSRIFPTKRNFFNGPVRPLRLCLIFLLFPVFIAAQSISGKVTNQEGEALPGAMVHWLGTESGAFTSADGTFSIGPDTGASGALIAYFYGFLPDTLEMKEERFVHFRLRAIRNLEELRVEGQRDGVILSDSKAIKTEQITTAELVKSACCDLAGCFETQTTVQPQTTNVLTNSKELRILGLSGVYNQVLTDGFPMIQGLSYTYGISSIPGSLVENIYVAKGANSVLQGFESISGQINVETKEPDNTETVLLNLYINNFSEKHFNAHYALVQKKWSNLTAVHVVRPADKIDRDKDRFLDLPLIDRYMVFNKWKYGDENEIGWNSRIGLRWLSEQRTGGQTFFESENDLRNGSAYGQQVQLNQPEAWMKTGYRFTESSAIVFFASGFHQIQKSFFGAVQYDAVQTNGYANIQLEHRYRTHELKTGFSFRHLDLSEDIAFINNLVTRTYAGNYRRLENISGYFAENTLRFFDDKLTWIAGFRADYHNQFALQLTPRTLVKYDITPSTIVRASIGTGWRTVNLISENIGLLSSSRDIVFAEKTEPEKAVNYGLNLTKKFENEEASVSGYFSADFYRTVFQNQIFPDYDSDPTKAFIRNFYGTSVSNGFQAELSLRFFQQVELKTGYNYLDVYRLAGAEKRPLPFNPTHKVLTSVSFMPSSKKYHIDVNFHWYGPQRLPDTKANPLEFQRPDFSQAYAVVNGQFTYTLKKVDVYAGCENIFNFRQLQPILSWQDPFSPFFDTSSVWGPTRGREFYIGCRFKLNNNE